MFLILSDCDTFENVDSVVESVVIDKGNIQGMENCSEGEESLIHSLLIMKITTLIRSAFSSFRC